MAKTDRVDAELIARFMTFRPEASRHPAVISKDRSGGLRDVDREDARARQITRELAGIAGQRTNVRETDD